MAHGGMGPWLLKANVHSGVGCAPPGSAPPHLASLQRGPPAAGPRLPSRDSLQGSALPGPSPFPPFFSPPPAGTSWTGPPASAPTPCKRVKACLTAQGEPPDRQAPRTCDSLGWTGGNLGFPTRGRGLTWRVGPDPSPGLGVTPMLREVVFLGVRGACSCPALPRGTGQGLVIVRLWNKSGLPPRGGWISGYVSGNCQKPPTGAAGRGRRGERSFWSSLGFIGQLEKPLPVPSPGAAAGGSFWRTPV